MTMSPDKTLPPGPNPDPRPGRNPGYDDANPHDAHDVPQHMEDMRGANFGKVPNPEIGGLARDTGANPDPTNP